MNEFFDWESESLVKDIPKHGTSRCFFNTTDIKIAQGYVTTKIINRYNKYVNINIQPGRAGIVLQETLFNTNIKYRYAYIVTNTRQSKRLIRRLPVEGFSDWLLIYDDTLFIEIVKGGCEEIEIIAV
ncbi:MAG: hypothetical protein QW416_07100 [Candidatus Nitrosocaldaceae archaeon]